MRSVHGHFELIPLTRLQGLFTFRGGLCHPPAAAALVQAAGVFAHVGIHLHLHSFNVGAMLRVNAENLRVKKHAAVAGCLAFELEAQSEILIRLFCGQVSVLVGCALAEDGSLLHHPLFFAILRPTSKVFSIEERNPAAPLWSLSQGAQPEEERHGEYATASFHHTFFSAISVIRPCLAKLRKQVKETANQRSGKNGKSLRISSSLGCRPYSVISKASAC